MLSLCGLSERANGLDGMPAVQKGAIQKEMTMVAEACRSKRMQAKNDEEKSR